MERSGGYAVRKSQNDVNDMHRLYQAHRHEEVMIQQAGIGMVGQTEGQGNMLVAGWRVEITAYVDEAISDIL